MFSGEDRGPVQRRFKVVTSEELPPPAPEEEAGGEEDGNLPQQLLQVKAPVNPTCPRSALFHCSESYKWVELSDLNLESGAGW